MDRYDHYGTFIEIVAYLQSARLILSMNRKEESTHSRNGEQEMKIKRNDTSNCEYWSSAVQSL